MAFPPSDLLAPVIPATVGDLGRLDRLAVDARDARIGVVTTGGADLPPQGVEDRLPGPVGLPLGEVVIHRALGRQVVREHVPLAPRTGEIEDGVEHLPHVVGPRPSHTINRDQRLDNRPLFVGQIGRVGLTHDGMSCCREIL